MGSQPLAPGRSASQRALLTREILARATELFGAQGYEKTTLNDIAAAVGISRSALYHYIASKEQLLVMLMDELSRSLDEAVAAMRNTAHTPEDKLRIFVAELVRHRAEHPDPFRLINQSDSTLPDSVRAQHLRARKTVLTELSAVIEEGIGADVFQTDDVRIAALTVVGMCNWVAWWFTAGKERGAEEIANQVSQAAVDMLRGRGRTPEAWPDAGAAFDSLRLSLDIIERSLKVKEAS
ncbi:TetR family transcriptional regulator [Catenulispora sp. NF23]|uniref:TetR/AcrR family transcriptional regulator n=1 Tax=Catenulispora pinistramenti TaxID=2705254 RepID=UPI001BAA0A16|nr:TetR/AcrR family transcriptional regulator [Catenulispora pinistramenti]MBS2531743.1 TetR family transcriptional regulator [Catenulispora pinistramenti]